MKLFYEESLRKLGDASLVGILDTWPTLCVDTLKVESWATPGVENLRGENLTSRAKVVRQVGPKTPRFFFCFFNANNHSQSKR